MRVFFENFQWISCKLQNYNKKQQPQQLHFTNYIDIFLLFNLGSPCNSCSLTTDHPLTTQGATIIKITLACPMQSNCFSVITFLTFLQLLLLLRPQLYNNSWNSVICTPTSIPYVKNISKPYHCLSPPPHFLESKRKGMVSKSSFQSNPWANECITHTLHMVSHTFSMRKGKGGWRGKGRGVKQVGWLSHKMKVGILFVRAG